MPEKYSKEKLEEDIRISLEPRVKKALDNAIKDFRLGDMTKFLLGVSILNSGVDYHITGNCIMAESVDIMTDCIKKANNVRVKALNKLGEVMVEKCGGKMSYLEEEKV